MDISSLSEDTFNPVQWINEHFKKHTQDKEEKTDEMALDFINTYVTKLQLYVQQVNYSLEECSQKVVANVPRILKDAATLQDNVMKLQQRMSVMSQEVAQVQDETGDCMATLERLNSRQINLQKAKESLQESDGWGNLITELEDHFEKSDLKSVCTKIVALQKSLLAQEQLPGHGERQNQVEDFKNRLEALASPHIVQCFIDSNKEEAQKYVRIFETIQRGPQLLQYYRAVQKNYLQQQWKQILDLQSSSSLADEDSTDDAVLQRVPNPNRIQQSFLNIFYDQLLDNYRKQLKWCNQVFGMRGEGKVDDVEIAKPQEQPLLVMIELLPALQPSRDSYILQLLKTSNDRLEMLQQFANDNKNFIQQLNVYMEQSAVKLKYDQVHKLSFSIYEYFHKFIQQYPRLEETQLSTRVDRLLISQTQASEAVRHLKDNTGKLFDWLKEALDRCSLITEDLALWKLIQLMNGIFKRLLEQFSKTQRQLTLTGTTSTVTRSTPALLNSISSNWSTLQYTLALLECLADLEQRLASFEGELCERLRVLGEKLEKTTSDENELSQKILIYNSYEKAECKRLLKEIKQHLEKNQQQQQQQRNNAPDDYDGGPKNSTDNYSLQDGPALFTAIHESIRIHCIETHEITMRILLQPLEIHLRQLEPEAGTRNMGQEQQEHIAQMPSYSFTPQEYVTQIGQYLLTLPQHLEPLLLSPSATLRQALEVCHVQYSQPGACAADVLLHLVVAQYCTLHQNRLLEIRSLSKVATKQLANDIEYVGSVLEELGLTLTSGLKQILQLLKVPIEEYEKKAAELDGEQRLTAIIRQMRVPPQPPTAAMVGMK